ncbi:hypothetical protein VHEMI10699 [[Torrubiella] hemipterigena]|uniref:Reverse transcriptase domain-containing protein n=1 Tax=[Torrubiella] hemipterigena TaxID=1531966 RepID=A0A0A1TJF3_9HYPO|nr:hypothetical protein VHEMI10699 [[Torrubiella] hemipterigena]
MQTLVRYSTIYIPTKKLHPRQATAFKETAKRLANAYLNKPSEQAILGFLLLPRILGIGLQQGNLNQKLRNYPHILPAPPPEQANQARPEPKELNSSLRAIELLEQGFLGRASQALVDQAPLAELTPELKAQLCQKHPIGPKDPFQIRARPHAGQPIKIDAIRTAICTTSKEKAPGLSGWTRSLLDIATADETDGSTCTGVLAMIRHIAEGIRLATAKGSYLLTASRLIALEKDDGGIRPIAIGDMIYRIAMKAVIATLFRPEMLLPNQLGVSSPGGVEPAIFALQSVIMSDSTEFDTITSADESNAFNNRDRTTIATAVLNHAPTLLQASAWALNHPALLVLSDGTALASAQGVRQDDPLASLLYSLSQRPTIEALQRKLPNSRIFAYLDDLYVLGSRKDPEIKPVLLETFTEHNLELNIRKTKEHKIEDLRTTGLPVLGSFVGPRAARKTFLEKKIDNYNSILLTLRTLPKQHALLLLKGSINHLLRHLLRQLDPRGLTELWQQADAATIAALGYIASRRLQPINIEHTALIGIPARQGGLGLILHTKVAKQLYAAARDANTATIQFILRGKTTPTTLLLDEPAHPAETAQSVLKSFYTEQLESLDSISEPERNALAENASYLGRRWIEVLPTSPNTMFTDAEITEGLRNRLLIPIKPPDLPCTHCAARTAINHQDTCKAAQRRYQARHDQINRAITKTLSCREDLEVAPEVAEAFDIVALQEPTRTSHVPASALLNYHVVFTDNGTATYVHKRHPTHSWSSSSTAFSTTIRFGSVSVTNVYRSGAISVLDIATLFNNLSPRTPHVIVGDFNAHHPSWDFFGRETRDSSDLIAAAGQARLVLVTPPGIFTWEPPGDRHGSSRPSTIDLVWASPPLQPRHIPAPRDLHGSDHIPQLTYIQHTRTPSPAPTRRWREADPDAIRALGATLIITPEVPTDSAAIDRALTDLHNQLDEIASATVPSRVPGSAAQPPWWSSVVYDAVISARRARRHRHDSDAAQERYRDAVRDRNRAIRQAKTAAWRRPEQYRR